MMTSDLIEANKDGVRESRGTKKNLPRKHPAYTSHYISYTLFPLTYSACGKHHLVDELKKHLVLARVWYESQLSYGSYSVTGVFSLNVVREEEYGENWELAGGTWNTHTHTGIERRERGSIIHRVVKLAASAFG